MCGFAGLLRHEAMAAPLLESVGARMNAALVHRGPDAAGLWQDAAAGVLLTHRRLSILDLSPQGAQPMHSACGRWVIAFNGEIYDHATLRARLPAVVWRGHSDTEVLTESIAAFGIDATLRACNGMYAFAAWDRAERVLHLARDRMGEKPLYYGCQGGTWLFGSELKAFRAWPDFRPEFDRDALALYLRHGYIPEPWTVWQGVRKLRPGHVVRITPGDGTLAAVTEHAHWTLDACIAGARAAPFVGSDAEAIDALEAQLRRTLRLRMVADVPLGAFLSGGIDSSVVVALMQAESPRPVRTFSIGFDLPDYDESAHAAAIARHLGTAHTEFRVTSAEAREVIPTLPQVYDEPFADSSQIPTLLVSRLARTEVTVAMSGDAGDELFGGYTRYFQALEAWSRSRRLPGPLRRLAVAALRALPPAAWDACFRRLAPVLPRRLAEPRAGEKLWKLAALLDQGDPRALYLRMVSLWPAPLEVVRGARLPATRLDDWRFPPEVTGLAERLMYLDTLTYLPGDILHKVDRASMAHSLETRVPFLDTEVVELAWRFPESLKVRCGTGKWVLREVLARHVPRTLFERPKMGFGVPIDAWLRGPLREWAEHLLDPARLAAGGLFDPAPVQALWKRHSEGRENQQYALWTVLMFEAWREHWARAPLPETPAAVTAPSPSAR